MLNLADSSYEEALKHAERMGDTDVFPIPFEFAAIRHDWKDLKQSLGSRDVLRWRVRAKRECLSPKSTYGFRGVTQLDPLDWLVYTALVIEIGAKMEVYRLPVNQERVFSWRFEPDGDGGMFSRTIGHRQFQKKTLELASGAYGQYVVLADIADYYPRLNHHRVENALNSAVGTNSNHSKAIIRLLGGWREKQSFGLPVGPSASRLIAEVAIHDVDQALQMEQLNFIRYVDDFRIFCRTQRDARAALSTLAEILWKSHGLTLTDYKTRILSAEEFKAQYAHTGEEAELEHLSETFTDIMEALDLDTWYEGVEYEELNDDLKAAVDALNLEELLDQQLMSNHLDLQLVRFILRRLTQLEYLDVSNQLLQNVDKLYPVFADVVRYLTNMNFPSVQYQEQIGQRLLGLLDDSIASHLEYHRLHLLSIFGGSANWGNVDQLGMLFHQESSALTKREIILALGRAGHGYWFRQRKTEWQAYSPWEQRAFLRGASCMEADERRNWYRSIEPRLKPLEKAIVNWSRANPIAG